MAEIIYSVLFHGSSISMDVSSDKIAFVVKEFPSVGITQSGIYFHSAEGCISNYNEITSLMILSKWKPKSVATNVNTASPDDHVTTTTFASPDDHVTTETHASPDDHVTTTTCASPGDPVNRKSNLKYITMPNDDVYYDKLPSYLLEDGDDIAY